MLTYFKKKAFKRRLLRKLQETLWELDANAQYDEGILGGVKKVVDDTEKKIMALVAEQDALEKEHTAEAREKKKALKTGIEDLRKSMTELAKQLSLVAESARGHRNRAAALRSRIEFIKANL